MSSNQIILLGIKISQISLSEKKSVFLNEAKQVFFKRERRKERTKKCYGQKQKEKKEKKERNINISAKILAKEK